MTTAISVEHLSKAYHLGQIGTGTFANDMKIWWAKARGKPNPMLKIGETDHGNRDGEEIWALRDVSFTVGPGEVLGIIGRNGAGKSTLLKILSRVTAPTSGRINVKGRVASLLEVGTGFHQDLTGRENVYLNGAILGMSRQEVTRKFDEIVDFSGVEKFIDTPVKRYSSGMYVRLAFAVAAHLEPEILVVDEVLAVGDAEFQKKCLGKMKDVGQEGRTVLFVSHNMPAITRLCERTILMDRGQLISDGSTTDVVSVYLQSGIGTVAAREWPDVEKAPGNHIARLCAVRVRSEDGQVTDAVDIRKPVRLEMEYEVLQSGHKLTPNFHLFNEDGINLFITADLDEKWRGRPRSSGHYTSTAWIPGNFLAEGTLIVTAAVSTMNPVIIHFHERDVVAFQVVDTLEGDSARGDWAKHLPGVVRPLLQWKTEYIPSAQSLPGVGES